MDSQTQIKKIEIKHLSSFAKFHIGTVKVKDITLLSMNARVMNSTKFNQLIENIRKDGGPSSSPLCYVEKDGSKITVLSGNHRIKACKVAGIEEVTVIYNQDVWSKDYQLRMQTSHNSLNGEDDVMILKQLMKDMESMDAIMESGIDMEKLEKIPTDKVSLIEGADNFSKEVVLFFSPAEMKEMKEKIQAADGVYDLALIAKDTQYHEFLETVKHLSDRYQVNNVAMILKLIIDNYKRIQPDTEKQKEFIQGECAIKGKRVVNIGSQNHLINELSLKKLREEIKAAGSLEALITKL